MAYVARRSRCAFGINDLDNLFFVYFCLTLFLNRSSDPNTGLCLSISQFSLTLLGFIFQIDSLWQEGYWQPQTHLLLGQHPQKKGKPSQIAPSQKFKDGHCPSLAHKPHCCRKYCLQGLEDFNYQVVTSLFLRLGGWKSWDIGWCCST